MYMYNPMLRHCNNRFLAGSAKERPQAVAG